MFTNNLPRYYFGENSAHQKDILSNQGSTSKYFGQMDKDQESGQPVAETKIDQSKDTNISLGITSVVEELYLSEPNLSRIPSPASSVASNKKLEWDSGADIGYNVHNSLKNSRKCKSFPILHVDLSPISHIIQFNDAQTCTTTVTAKMTENPQKHSPQSVEDKSVKLYKKKESFQHSTPIEHKISTKLTMSLRHDDNSTVRTESKSKNKDRTVQKSKNVDECLQTTLIHISSKSVQTDDECLLNKKEDKSKVNRSQQTDAINLSSERSSTGGSSSQTSSFQYIPGPNVISGSPSENVTDSSKSNKSASTNITPAVRKSLQSNITASKSKLKLPLSSRPETNTSNSSNSHSQSSDGSNNSPLGKIISTQQSKNLIADIDKSLYILQRFLKSKNYNTDTKKYYAKKIVNKIIQNKYTGDSSGSNKSDECCCTSTSNSSTERTKIDSTHASNIAEKSEQAGSNNQIIQSKESNEFREGTLQNDVKQPGSSNADFVDCAIQCDPEQSYFINQNYSSDKKSVGQGTTVSTELGITLSFKDDKKRQVKSVSREYLTDIYSDTSSKNWKEDKTLSEKLFEAKQKYSSSSEPTTRNNSLGNKVKQRLSAGLSPSKSDYLIEHSKKERKRQLSWINNEIMYLRELKKLLQNKDVTSDVSNDTTDTVEINMEETKTERIQHQTSGETNHSRSSSLNINHLSKYLTNEQIKFLIKHDVSKIHHHTCTCCKSQSKSMDASSKHWAKDQSQTTGNKSSCSNTVLSEINGFSYNSHNYNVSRNLKSSQVSTKSTPKENQYKITVEKPTEMMDAGIQCTIRKKKKSDSSNTQHSEVSSTVCTDISKVNVSDSTPSVCISVENVYNSTNTDETSRTTPSDSLDQISKRAKSRKPGKENQNIHSAKASRNNKHPLAYFLTFEEKPPSDLSMNQDTANKKVLPNVVVKVPKLRKASKDKIDANKDVPDYTLQVQYLFIFVLIFIIFLISITGIFN